MKILSEMTLKDLASLLETVDQTQIKINAIVSSDTTKPKNTLEHKITISVNEEIFPMDSLFNPTEFLNSVENQLEEQRRKIIQTMKSKL